MLRQEGVQQGVDAAAAVRHQDGLVVAEKQLALEVNHWKGLLVDEVYVFELEVSFALEELPNLHAIGLGEEDADWKSLQVGLVGEIDNFAQPLEEYLENALVRG